MIKPGYETCTILLIEADSGDLVVGPYKAEWLYMLQFVEEDPHAVCERFGDIVVRHFSAPSVNAPYARIQISIRDA